MNIYDICKFLMYNMLKQKCFIAKEIRMQDVELKDILNMPSSTISEWKKADNYRLIIYEILKNMPKEELQKKVEAIKTLKGIG